MRIPKHLDATPHRRNPLAGSVLLLTILLLASALFACDGGESPHTGADPMTLKPEPTATQEPTAQPATETPEPSATPTPEPTVTQEATALPATPTPGIPATPAPILPPGRPASHGIERRYGAT